MAFQGMKRCANIFQIVSMHVEECLGVSENHKGELGQSAWKLINKRLCQGMSVNSRCPMDKVC